MGLPIWRNPEEAKVKKEHTKVDPTAGARSPIRRERPPYARRRTPPRHESSSNFPPRFQRSPPPSMGFNGMREGRRAENRSVPPISSLLESANARGEPRSYEPAGVDELATRERHLEASIDRLNNEADRLEGETTARQDELDLPTGWESWTQSRRSAWLADRRRPSPRYRMSARDYEQMRRDSPREYRPNARSARRSALPTPPEDESADPDSLFLPDNSASRRTNGDAHPLRQHWAPQPLVDGLGDRIRSPTPGDGWEIMRATITPDATLPSADSSFTSAAAANSFSSNSTSATEANSSFSSVNSRQTSRAGGQAESISSVDPDDLRNDDDREVEAEFAAAMYAQELTYPEGCYRVREHRTRYRQEGRQYAYSDEPEPVEVGFRIINEALSTSEGRERVDQLARTMNEATDDMAQRIRTRRPENTRSDSPRRPSALHHEDDSPPSPHPERYSEETRAAAREMSDDIYEIFERIGPVIRRPEPDFTFPEGFRVRGMLADSRSRSRSPPPRYSPPHTAATSHAAPEAHPVGPPSMRSQREVGEMLGEGSESELEGLQRIAERMAQRGNVPDEWWMSMGMSGLSRSRARSPGRRRGGSGEGHEAAGTRVREGRVGRGNSRL
ncbi:uncharacterized protein LTR77_004474 [Saxophila tyrrhenica]|uniref:Uncharacterized protein n=1 Tax=Saxophila tyrrhenica TaxID=1690608 RepID=A0AAV9PDK3_9PEZI|nr:hypothetical protein LTR77_004474 [Saxophila tyrrhenica]